MDKEQLQKKLDQALDKNTELSNNFKLLTNTYSNLAGLLTKANQLDDSDLDYFCLNSLRYQTRVKVTGLDLHKARIYCLSLRSDIGAKFLNPLNSLCEKVSPIEDSLTKLIADIKSHVTSLAVLIENNIHKLTAMNPYFLITLMKLCYLNKYIYLAYRLRQLAVTRFAQYDVTHLSGLSLLEVIKARAELYQDRGCDISNLPRFPKKYNHAIDNIGLYFNNREKLIAAKHFSESEKNFKDYLAGKSIAIVGPVSLGQQNGAEIDSFDVVIRFNYLGLSKYNKDEFGSKTNTSYYIENTVKRHKMGMVAVAHELDFIVHQKTSPRIYPEFHDLKIPMRSMLSAWSEAINPYFLANPNAVQKTLLDILRFSIGRIKIFNSNLFVDKTINPAYRNSSLKPGDFIWHDVFSQFIFTKRLFQNNIIEVDNVLADILNMTLDEYALEMDRVHGERLVKESLHE